MERISWVALKLVSCQRASRTTTFTSPLLSPLILIGMYITLASQVHVVRLIMQCFACKRVKAKRPGIELAIGTVKHQFKLKILC